ncbi:MAG: phosphatidate cytidylyltransferase [Rhodobacteraceae bacterium]|nr:phosphatidate cytidylyltransferase [Paracoccaceae bacterium]
MTTSAKWEDLARRTASGIAMAVVGLGAIWSGGAALAILAAIVTGLMIWELAMMTAGARARIAAPLLGLFAAGILYGAVTNHAAPVFLAALALPPVAAAIVATRLRVAVLAYGTAILLTGYALVAFRAGYGLGFVLWLVLLVVVTDVMGYFGGRLIGGPKFWPKVSPKKTWSGTLAGWAGAAVLAACFVLWAGAPAWLIGFSVIVAFASQLGDIAESAIKRRTGVKDSSNILPGHGGVLDRFDGLIGAVTLLVLWGFVLPLPGFGG